MDGALYFVYKITMPVRLEYQGDYPILSAPAALQLLIVAFNRLIAWEHDNLSAPYWRWYWNDTPGASVSVKGRWMPLGPGVVMLIPPGVPFASTTRRLVGHLHMHFTIGFNPDEFSPDTAAVMTHRPDGGELKRIRRLKRLLTARRMDAGTGFLAQSLVSHALTRVPASFWNGWSADAEIQQVMKLIHDRLGQPLSSPQMARHAGMSVNTLMRRFRRATGQTPHQYALRLRLDRAMQLLRGSHRTIEDIAETTGFCDRFHLSRVFRAQFGSGPAAFRKSQQEP